jgi:hypothetical protein
MSQKLLGVALLGALAVGAAACSDTAGVNGTAEVAVSMRIDGSAVAVSSFDGSALLSMGKLNPSEVDSLFVEVTGMSFLSCDSACMADTTAVDDECCGEWHHLALETPVMIDLMALPADADSAFVIASGDLPIGEYQKIRINVGEASIWLNTYQSKGQEEFLPDTPYGVTVPSGRLNTNVGLTVEDDGTGLPVAINLVFDPNMTFQNVHTTGSGKVILTPQFRLF